MKETTPVLCLVNRKELCGYELYHEDTFLHYFCPEEFLEFFPKMQYLKEDEASKVQFTITESKTGPLRLALDEYNHRIVFFRVEENVRTRGKLDEVDGYNGYLKLFYVTKAKKIIPQLIDRLRKTKKDLRVRVTLKVVKKKAICEYVSLLTRSLL